MDNKETLNIDVWNEEQQLKETVYTHLTNEKNDRAVRVNAAQKYVESGSYESQDAFTAYNELGHQHSNEADYSYIYRALYPSPYFAHMELADGSGRKYQMMLSDAPDLDSIVDFSIKGKSIVIVPFKQSDTRPMYNHLFTQYQKGTVGMFTLRDAKSNVQGYRTYSVDLIRNVEIKNREIRSVFQLAPELDENTNVSSFDTILAQRLDENRANAKLQNIISTLQKKQFDVIRRDIGSDFVVQGCPGSGKTQCLIHRLFFYRDILNNRGWKKVLLITPTKLFRDYSYELMRRYNLLDVKNCSLASFYYELLTCYDNRFKSRQYQIEITEEYLPDAYLQEVYSAKFINSIENEIKQAIVARIEHCCSLLELPFSNDKVSKSFVDKLIRKLDDKLRAFDERAHALEKKSDNYTNAMATLEKLEKELKSAESRQTMLEKTRFELDSEKAQHDRLIAELNRAMEELKSWEDDLQSRIDARRKACEDWKKKAEDKSHLLSNAEAKYARALKDYQELTDPSTEQYRQNAETRDLLTALLESAKADLEAFLNGRTEKEWNSSYVSRYRNNALSISNTRQRVKDLTEQVDDLTIKVLEMIPQDESLDKQKLSYREALEKAKYNMIRLESSIFEDEVWKVLTLVRKKHGVQEYAIEKTASGQQRQTRILYKADLLFYLRVYAQLYDKSRLPRIEFICIDEGQDLHRADYRLLKNLYPSAQFNVFGDTSQVLHQSCGVSDWRRDTGIETIIEMNYDYRNRPEIVDFCNRKFRMNMESIPTIRSKQYVPQVLKNAKDIPTIVRGTDKLAIIVKDRKHFDEMLDLVPSLKQSCQFIDTNAEKEVIGGIRCYSVFAAKGLEFSNVFVFSKDMTSNQQLVACTRALDKLYYL